MKLALLLLIVAIMMTGAYFIFNNKLNTGFSLGSASQAVSSPKMSESPSSASTPGNAPQTAEADTSLPEVVKVTMVTAKGNIDLELYPKVAPRTVTNFLKLASEKFYDETKFHRVVDNFVIQGGDPLSKTDSPDAGKGGPGYTFEDEINPKALNVLEETIRQYEQQGYKYNYDLKSLPVNVGAIAMANAGPNTNGSQFFIVTTTDQPSLNGKHTVFGKVIGGMDVVRAIKQGDVLKQIIPTAGK